MIALVFLLTAVGCLGAGWFLGVVVWPWWSRRRAQRAEDAKVDELLTAAAGFVQELEALPGAGGVLTVAPGGLPPDAVFSLVNLCRDFTAMMSAAGKDFDWERASPDDVGRFVDLVRRVQGGEGSKAVWTEQDLRRLVEAVVIEGVEVLGLTPVVVATCGEGA